jgi:hypothetical protein
MAKKNQRIIETQRELPSAIDIKTGVRRIKEKHASRRVGRLKNKKAPASRAGAGRKSNAFGSVLNQPTFFQVPSD